MTYQLNWRQEGFKSLQIPPRLQAPWSSTALTSIRWWQWLHEYSRAAGKHPLVTNAPHLIVLGRKGWLLKGTRSPPGLWVMSVIWFLGSRNRIWRCYIWILNIQDEWSTSSLFQPQWILEIVCNCMQHNQAMWQLGVIFQVIHREHSISKAASLCTSQPKGQGLRS